MFFNTIRMAFLQNLITICIRTANYPSHSTEMLLQGQKVQKNNLLNAQSSRKFRNEFETANIHTRGRLKSIS